MLCGFFRDSFCLPLSCVDLCGISPSRHDVYSTRGNCHRILCTLDNSASKDQESAPSLPGDLLIRFLKLFEDLHRTEARHEILREELSTLQEFLFELQKRQGYTRDAATLAGMCSIDDLRKMLPKRLSKFYERKLCGNPWSRQSHSEALHEAVPLLSSEIEL